MSVKLKRQNIIKTLLIERMISSQEQLIKILRDYDIKITQATLSRDFAELGVVRTFNELGVRYVLNADESGSQIAKLIGFEILNVEHNENLIVIRTLAGRAQGVAHFIDRMNSEKILGTVGGDDTVLIIPSKLEFITEIVSLIKGMMNNNPNS